MKRKVAYKIVPIIEPLQEDWFMVNNKRRGASCIFRDKMESIGQGIPRVPYMLTYTLAPKRGVLECASGFFHIRINKVGGGKSDYFFCNCLVPSEWAGMRFNRKIRLLAGEEEPTNDIATS